MRTCEGWVSGRSATYTYDALNRVSTARSQATSGSNCWGQSFAYDRYANLTTVNVTQCTAPMLSLSFNTDNEITNSGFSYDAAGDLTGDGVNTYSWNAEQHLSSAAGVSYTYDGDLRRVKKSNGTLYWYCEACGQVLAESDSSGNITSEYTYFGDRRIARRDVSSGNVYYIFSDRLGSYRTLTDSSGNVKGESDYYPFGAERVVSSTVTDSFRFAGMEWDSEDGLNHTPYRQYTPAQSRWETPDPVRGWTSFPQGQNLYAYVKDNPTNLTDPSGAIIAVWCDPSDASTDCSCDPWLDPWCPGWPGGPVEADGGGNPPLPVTCNCYLLLYTLKFMGCYYSCGCSDGTTKLKHWGCSIFQQDAGEPCPKECTYVNGVLVYPLDPCGPWIKPPRPPKGPHPPEPIPPPPPPGPEPIPVPLMTGTSGG